MDPILLIVVVFASVQRVRRQNQQEMFRLPYALQKVVVKLAGF